MYEQLITLFQADGDNFDPFLIGDYVIKNTKHNDSQFLFGEPVGPESLAVACFNGRRLAELRLQFGHDALLIKFSH